MARDGGLGGAPARCARYLTMSALMACLMAGVPDSQRQGPQLPLTAKEGVRRATPHSATSAALHEQQQRTEQRLASRSFRKLDSAHDQPPERTYYAYYDRAAGQVAGPNILPGRGLMDMEPYGAQLSPNIRNYTNATMRLGMELRYGDLLLDVDFAIAFKNSSNFSNFDCQDRGARCLPAELRYQMKDPDSKLFRVLQNGRFAQLLASNSDLQTSAMSTHFLFERRQRSRAGRTLLQAPVPELEEVQKSQELLLLQVSLLLGKRQISQAPKVSALGLLHQVRLSSKAALFDLTPRLSSISAVDAIKEQDNIMNFLDAALERFKALGTLPPLAIDHIVNVLYTLTQAAFCTKVSVPPGFESGSIYEDEKDLPPSVALKKACLVDGTQDSTFPMRDRLARVQYVLNKTAAYVSQYGQSDIEHEHRALALDPLLLDIDGSVVAAPDEASGEAVAASPVFSMWLRSFSLPSFGEKPRTMEVRPNHRDAKGSWVIPGSMVSVRVARRVSGFGFRV